MNSYEEKTKQKLTEVFTAMETPEKWTEYKKEQIRSVVGDIEQKKCDDFADFLNKRFLDAVKINNGIEINRIWHTLSDSEKLKFAERIANTLIDLLKSDIRNNRVTVYKNDGDVYTPTNDTFDMIFKQETTNYIDTLKITTHPTNRALMHVSMDKKLGINLNWELYKSMGIFLMDLRHEMMHVVDMFIPQISALKPDVRTKSIRYYVNNEVDRDLYENNPLEVNANLKRREFRKMYDAMITQDVLNQVNNYTIQQYKQNVRA